MYFLLQNCYWVQFSLWKGHQMSWPLSHSFASLMHSLSVYLLALNTRKLSEGKTLQMPWIGSTYFMQTSGIVRWKEHWSVKFHFSPLYTLLIKVLYPVHNCSSEFNFRCTYSYTTIIYRLTRIQDHHY